MSRAGESIKTDSALVRALVNRQAQAWEERDFAIAADDWLTERRVVFSRESRSLTNKTKPRKHHVKLLFIGLSLGCFVISEETIVGPAPWGQEMSMDWRRRDTPSCRLLRNREPES
jgi:hypothetical protein